MGFGEWGNTVWSVEETPWKFSPILIPLQNTKHVVHGWLHTRSFFRISLKGGISRALEKPQNWSTPPHPSWSCIGKPETTPTTCKGGTYLRRSCPYSLWKGQRERSNTISNTAKGTVVSFPAHLRHTLPPQELKKQKHLIFYPFGISKVMSTHSLDTRGQQDTPEVRTECTGALIWSETERMQLQNWNGNYGPFD